MQKMKFAELYRQNRAAVERALISMWCAETNNESQKAYVNQIQGIVGDLFASPKVSPVIQRMTSYKSTNTTSDKEARDLVGELWEKSTGKKVSDSDYYPPYEHQYQSWKTLLKDRTDDGKLKSICVTTGTGSGKTECFMVPLVRDLIDHGTTGQTQAIFLYPLNALMEDQKERLQKLLKDTELTFAVYNGDMPEDDKGDNKRKVNLIKGMMPKIDENGNEVKDGNGNTIYEAKFPNIIADRTTLRQHPADILLTNPTMLEYILLRKSDNSLVNPGQHSLRWVAIDETHTYTGAGAAELAMLLRRVLMAFKVRPDAKADDGNAVRFSTSSATMGGISNIKDEEEKKEAIKQQEAELRKFIADISGLSENQVEIIDGEPKDIDMSKTGDDEQYWKKIHEEEYVTLNDLFPGDGSVEEKLERLDEMCDRAEGTGLRLKVHFYYRVPNGGFYVRLTEQNDGGSFKLYTENPVVEDGEAPFLELSRCNHCGEFLALAEVDETDSNNKAYAPLALDDSDMFDLPDHTDNEKKQLAVFALRNRSLAKSGGTIYVSIRGNHYTSGEQQGGGGWNIVVNKKCKCPNCGWSLSKEAPSGEIQTEDEKRLKKFRVASDFVSRLIAPSCLDQMEAQDDADIHDGQQFISFVDNRQMAAKSSLKQNLEEERLWVYSKIFHELTQKKLNVKMDAKRKNELRSLISKNDDKFDDYTREYNELNQNSNNEYITWQDITTLLSKDPMSDVYAYQFAKRTEKDGELDDDLAAMDPNKKGRYIQAIMVEYLSRRPKEKASPETMGLFTTCYPELEENLPQDEEGLPQAIKNFNAKINNPDLRIAPQDWHNLLQVEIDYTIRSNQWVYLDLGKDKEGNDLPMDIFKAQRYETVKDPRRVAIKPTITNDSRKRHICYLAKLLVKDGQYNSVQQAISDNVTILQEVTDAMWTALCASGFLQISTHYDDQRNQYVEDKTRTIDGITHVPYRMNLARMCFKLFEDVKLCDVNASDNNMAPKLRPVETTFKNFSPYVSRRGEPLEISEDLSEPWEPFEYYKGSGKELNLEDLREWAEENRKLLWDNQLWGEHGIFADRYENIYRYPNLFVEAEHTAQVAKIISRKVQEDFKRHKLNILACSTTMEMGVDLGDLELVMLLSVPPMPANYKQRAGRSGRREKMVRSACITLCGSDAIGLRTLNDPIHNLIGRPIKTPSVDLSSTQVVQRHVNAFLIRHSGIFNRGDNGGNLSQRVLDYYTEYTINREGRDPRIEKSTGDIVSPKDGLGSHTGTKFSFFNDFCSGGGTDRELAQAYLDLLDNQDLKYLLKGTIYQTVPVNVILSYAKKKNEDIYNDLAEILKDFEVPYQSAVDNNQPRAKDYFYRKFIAVLDQRLLQFWATHRFTPNANMPINVVEFEANGRQQTWNRVDNPSYPLQRALSQYAPGNSVALDGRVVVVRGVRHRALYRQQTTFKNLYRNEEQVVIDAKDMLANRQKWSVSGSESVELVVPTAFIPDQHESPTRALETNVYTHVSAQLIGVDQSPINSNDIHLFMARSNMENGMILYYNEGIGFGYCYCSRCGKAVLETEAAATSAEPEKLPTGMNNRKVKKDDEEIMLHYKLDSSVSCDGHMKSSYIRRNVIFGDLIQTDFADIKIRHLGLSWIRQNTLTNEKSLLTTLGLLFCQALTDLKGWERSAVDFTLTPNGHICVFDTNPGGSGYSNQLSKMDVMKEVILRAKDIVKVAVDLNSRDVLIDHFALHYVNDIDYNAANKWIEEELELWNELPDDVKDVMGDAASQTTLADLEKAFDESNTERVLFANSKFETWDYGDTSNGWRGKFMVEFQGRGSLTTFCLLDPGYISLPVKEVGKEIKGWTKKLVSISNPFAKSGIYPLAYIDGKLYVTINEDCSSLNNSWGSGAIYVADMDFKMSNAADVNTETEITDSDKNIWFKLSDNNEEGWHINSNELGEKIYNKEGARKMIDDFIDYCRGMDGKLEIKYQDEHLKSVLGMVITLQTIGYFVNKIGKEFSLEFFLEKYIDYNADPKNNYITANFDNSSKRNAKLNELVEGWIGEAHGNLVPIESKERGSLPHWRELSITCGTRQLVLYPDGGFANGWLFDSQNNITGEKFYRDNTTIQDNIPIKLKETIKIGISNVVLE